MEVPAGDDLAGGEHERVVGRGVHLDTQHALELAQRVPRGPVDLRHAAQAVRVLHPVRAVRVGGADLAAGEQLAKVTRNLDLAGMRPGRDELLVEGRRRAEHRLQAHRPDHIGRAGQPHGVMVGEGPDAGHQLGAVEQRQSLLGAEGDRCQAGAVERRATRLRVGAGDAGRALADEDERDVRQRGEIARCAQAAVRRDDRVHRSR